MELNAKQKVGLDTALFRYNHGLGYTVISGYAGTGKSTLVKFIVSALHIPEEEIVYCAYTGKACKVLQQKGNNNVLTLHKLLYTFQALPDGTYIQKPKAKLDYHFIIVDECSMLPQEMVDLLLKYMDTYIIFLGDPFQLPPPAGEENNLLANSHVFLDEIMRQALDNEIIKFSMDIREGRELPDHYDGENVKIYKKDQLTTKHLEWADQILCATNAMRQSVNNQMRDLNGLTGEPQVGDKIICLKNNWDIFDDDGNALVNGTIGTIDSIETKFFPVYKYFKIPNNKVPYYQINLTTEEGTHFNVCADINLFSTGTPYLNDKQRYMLSRHKMFQNTPLPNSFAYAYAVTGWKAQGGEWGKVLVLEEPFPYDKLEHQRFLYTAITRATNKVVIIKK